MILTSAEYLRGQEKDNKECANLFKDYQQCLKVSFGGDWGLIIANILAQGALKERGIDKLVAEAREENKENDLKHLGSKSLSPSHYFILTEEY